jgi:hypothetical protein
LRAEIANTLEEAKKPVSNLTKKEREAIKELNNNDSIVITPADKGKCIVVMDRDEYERKMLEKLADETTYKEIVEDPTMKIKEELTEQLQRMRNAEEISKAQYRRLLPTQTQIPRIYGQPKIHKAGNPLREIVDATGSVTRDANKFVANIIKKYAVKGVYRLKDSEEFVSKMSEVSVEEGEELVSFDVVALYPSVPQEEAIELVRQELSADTNLKDTTTVSAENVVKLLKICVGRTYFTFKGKIYEQVDGLAIGAPTSGFLADIFMNRLEREAMDSFVNPPRVWWRFVDDVLATIKTEEKQKYLDHLNGRHQRIKFTMEEMKDSKIAFLDTEVKIREDGGVDFKIYRKPTHTDQYLSFNSNHHISQKIGIVHTLRRRNEKLVTREDDRIEEEEKIRTSLKRCGYPNWTLKKKQKENKERSEDRNLYVSIPYVKNVSEKLARSFRSYGISTTHKPSRTIKSAVCNMKEKVHEMDKVNAIYEFKCKKHGATYVGETGRALKARGYDHRIVSHKDSLRSHMIAEPIEMPDESENIRRSKRNEGKVRRNYRVMDQGEKLIETEGTTEPAKHMYHFQRDHSEGDIEFKAIGYERHWQKREIKEAIEVKRRDPNLNKLLNKKDSKGVPPIYENVLKSRETRLCQRQVQTTVLHDWKDDLIIGSRNLNNGTLGHDNHLN